LELRKGAMNLNQKALKIMAEGTAIKAPKIPNALLKSMIMNIMETGFIFIYPSISFKNIKNATMCIIVTPIASAIFDLSPREKVIKNKGISSRKTPIMGIKLVKVAQKPSRTTYFVFKIQSNNPIRIPTSIATIVTEKMYCLS